MEFLIENAIDGGESMDIIIQNLLELSRAQAGRLQLNQREIILRDMIRAVVEKVQDPLSRITAIR